MRNTQLPDSLAWQVILREPLMAMIARSAGVETCRHAGGAGERAVVFFDPAGGKLVCMTIFWA